MLLHPGDWAVGGQGNDMASVAWSFDHVAHSLAHGQWPVGHTDRVMFPDGGGLAPAALFEAMLLAPLTWVFGAVATFNLMQLAHPALAAAAGTWAGQRWGASRSGSVMTGLVLGFSPAMLASAFNQNPDATSIFWVGLCAGMARGATGWRAMALGAMAGVASWSSPYVGVMATLTALALMPWTRAAIARALGGVALMGLPNFFMVMATLQAGSVVGGKIGDPTSTPLTSLLIPHIELFGLKSGDGVLADGAYLGLALLAAAALFSARASLSRRRWLLLALAGGLLALGPALVIKPGLGISIPAPGVLWASLPGLGDLRITSRFSQLGSFALALGVATASPPRWLMGLIVFDLVVLPGGLALLAAEPAPFADECQALRELDGPVAFLGSERSDRGLSAALCHRRPTSEGIKMGMPPSLRRMMRRQPSAATAQALRGQGFVWVAWEPITQSDPKVQRVIQALLSCEEVRPGAVTVARLSTCD